MNQAELPEGDYVYLDVIGAASGSAMPLSQDWFAGDHDSRWRLNDQNCFEQVRVP